MFFKDKYNVRVEPVQGPWNPVAVRRFSDGQGRTYSEICVNGTPVWLGEREQEDAMIKALRAKFPNDYRSPIAEEVTDLGKAIRDEMMLWTGPRDVGLFETEKDSRGDRRRE